MSSVRTVSVTNRENLPQRTVSLAGPAFGPWQATAQASNLNTSDPNFNGFGNAMAVTASQQSDFSASGITFSGFGFIDYAAVFTINQGGSVLDQFDATFHIAGPCAYQFQSIFAFAGPGSEISASVQLTSATSGTIWSLTNSGIQSGSLATGDYTLSFLIQGNSGGALSIDARRQIDASFMVPAPAHVFAPMCLGLAALRRRR